MVFLPTNGLARGQALLPRYAEVFQVPQGLPPPRPHDNVTTLQTGASPLLIRPYQCPYFQKTEIERMVRDMLDEGIIVPSSSSFSSLVLLVKKKYGTWCFCIDYRALKAVTVLYRFPIPTVDELYGACHFSKLNIHSGYHQVRVRPADTQNNI